MAKHSITAVFDTRSHADQAVAQLKSSGVPASDITVLPADGETGTYTDEAEGRTRGFWGSLEQLFGGTEDHATYAESIRRGGILLTVRAEDDRLDSAIDILEQHGSVDLDERETTWRGEGWTGSAPLAGASSTGMGYGLADGADSRTGTAALGAGAGALGTTAFETRPATTPVAPATLVTDGAVTDRAVADRAAVPVGARAGGETLEVYEERLDVGKRSINRGRVRVHTRVVSQDVTENVTLHGETVVVDRRTVDRPVSATGLDLDPFQERTIEMEEYAEEAVVGKSAHVVEEIGIRKEGADRVETVRETLRKTVVDVEDGRTTGTVTGAVTGAAGTLGRFAAEIRDDMEVVGSDGAHVGIVDHLDGNRIKLKKADIAAGGQHHYLAQDLVGSVAGKVMLAVTAAEAKARWAAA